MTFTNSGGTPLFPKGMCYRNFEFGTGTMNPMPKKTITEIRYKVFADDMPFMNGKFEPEQIFKESHGI